MNDMNSSPDLDVFTLDHSLMAKWRSEFFEKPLNKLALNVCTAGDPISASQCVDLERLVNPGTVRHDVDKVTKATVGGPNWICMGLDKLRHYFTKKCELSAPYLFYWHKLERCNYFLHAVKDCLARCEPVDGRTFRYLMKHTVPDGGNWHMFVNLVQKYGIMPRQCYLASWSSSRPLHLNRLLKSKLHEYSSRLHATFTLDGDAHNLPPMIQAMLGELYKVISICLGTPPVEFVYETEEEGGAAMKFTPKSFLEHMVAVERALEAQVCLGHDPRQSSSYQHNYHIAYSSNMVGGLEQSYINEPIDLLLEVIVNSLAAGSPVWLTCDVQLIFKNKSKIFSLTSHNFEQVFSMPVGTALNKAERMLYKATCPNTVMLLAGVTLDAQHQPLHFRTMHQTTEPHSEQPTPSTESLTESVSDTADEGALKRKRLSGQVTVLHVDWLREYAFKVVVDAQFVPPGVMHALRTQPSVELPIWDPMGALLG